MWRWRYCEGSNATARGAVFLKSKANTVSRRDLDLIRSQIGREPRGVVEVVTRCPWKAPQVIKNRPVVMEKTDRGAQPKVFPTLYWLTCPELVSAISRLEAEGMVASLQRQIESDPRLRQEMEKAHARYARQRLALLDDEGFREEYPKLFEVIRNSGVGGIRGQGIKCLHTHYADYLAAGDNPVGELVHQELKRRGWLELSMCDTCGHRLKSGEPANQIGNDNTAEKITGASTGPTTENTLHPRPIAVAKIGTNSCRLLVASVDTGKSRARLHSGQAGEGEQECSSYQLDCRGAGAEKPYQVNILFEAQEVTRIGEGVSQTGSLSEAAMARTVVAIERFVELAHSFGAPIVRLVGTSALRDAGNSHRFVSQLKQRTGLELEVIGGAAEAELSFLGATSAMSAAQRRRAVVVDIGGGSTEVMGSGDKAAVSLDVGAVRLYECWLSEQGTDCGGPEQWTVLKHFAAGAVQNALNQAISSPAEKTGGGQASADRETTRNLTNQVYPFLTSSRGSGKKCQLVGVGGTFTTLAALKKQLKEYSRDEINGTVLSRDEVEYWGRHIYGTAVNQRLKIPGLGPGREDIAPMGIAIALAFMELLASETVHISTDDMLLGMVLAAAGLQDGKAWSAHYSSR